MLTQKWCSWHFSQGLGVKEGNLLYKVDLCEDISGKYFPGLDKKDSIYFKRKDGRVELTGVTENRSSGKIVEDRRDKIRGKQEKTEFPAVH